MCKTKDTGLIFEAFFREGTDVNLMNFRYISFLRYSVYLFVTGSNGIEISYCKTKGSTDFTDIKHDAIFSIFSIKITPYFRESELLETDPVKSDVKIQKKSCHVKIFLENYFRIRIMCDTFLERKFFWL